MFILFSFSLFFLCFSPFLFLSSLFISFLVRFWFVYCSSFCFCCLLCVASLLSFMVLVDVLFPSFFFLSFLLFHFFVRLSFLPSWAVYVLPFFLSLDLPFYRILPYFLPGFLFRAIIVKHFIRYFLWVFSFPFFVLCIFIRAVSMFWVSFYFSSFRFWLCFVCFPRLHFYLPVRELLFGPYCRWFFPSLAYWFLIAFSFAFYPYLFSLLPYMYYSPTYALRLSICFPLFSLVFFLPYPSSCCRALGLSVLNRFSSSFYVAFRYS